MTKKIRVPQVMNLPLEIVDEQNEATKLLDPASVPPLRWNCSAMPLLNPCFAAIHHHTFAKFPTDLARLYPAGILLEALEIVRADIKVMNRHCRMATEAQINDVLKGLAQMFQVRLPDYAGLQLYYRSLGKLPYPALLKAAEKVVDTHRYNKLPFPADFHEAGVEEANLLRLVYDMLVRIKDRLIEALLLLGHRVNRA